jgi:hypothetical protein
MKTTRTTTTTATSTTTTTTGKQTKTQSSANIFFFSKCSLTFHSCELQGNGLQQKKNVTPIYSLVLLWRTVSY